MAGNKTKSTKAKSRKKSAAKKTAGADYRVEITIVVLAFFAFFSFLGWFFDAIAINFLFAFEKGLFGYGAYVIPFLLIVMIYLLLTEKHEQLTVLRLILILLLPLLIGAVIFTFSVVSFEWSENAVSQLWYDAQAGEPGGVLSGLLAAALTSLVSNVGSVVVLIIFLILSLLATFNILIIDLIRAIRDNNIHELKDTSNNADKLVKKVSDTKRKAQAAHAQNVEKTRQKKELKTTQREAAALERNAAKQELEAQRLAAARQRNEQAAEELRRQEEAYQAQLNEQQNAVISEPVDNAFVERPAAAGKSSIRKNNTVPGQTSMDDIPLKRADAVPELTIPELIESGAYLNGRTQTNKSKTNAAAVSEKKPIRSTAGYTREEFEQRKEYIAWQKNSKNEEAAIPVNDEKINTCEKADAETEIERTPWHDESSSAVSDETDIKFDTSSDAEDAFNYDYEQKNSIDMETQSADEDLSLDSLNIDSSPENMETNLETEYTASSAGISKGSKKTVRVERIEKAEMASPVVIPTDAGEEENAYRFPPVELLDIHNSSSDNGTETASQRNNLSETLKSFGINPDIVGTVRGPTVTRYELKLGLGVKLTKITSLSDDIALALGSSGVRISAIPEKQNVVGIEVPNHTVSTVGLRDVIDSDEFRRSKSNVSFAVGKDIGGNRIIGNIGKLPHLLIAGTTGSGKSVCINSLIISLLYKSSPEDVKMIMVDPKMVELGVYNGIPHLMIPVVTDPKKAAGSLQWAVEEMMRRYTVMSECGVRDIATYNKVIAEKNMDRKKLPAIVVIIDELADLMMAAAKEVEESICRVAQMGRAAGVHLVIATQRPSANVITGLMKANIPSRIALAVASAMESRIILDAAGAEKLVGHGDMLYAPLGEGKPRRIQGCYVSDDEIQKVADFVKCFGTAEYDKAVLDTINRKAAASGKPAANYTSEETSGTDDDRDEMLYDAVSIFLELNQASTSVLQRKLKIGYARASRIVDQMEEMGIVGPHKGSKPRDILITKEKWAEIRPVLESGGTAIPDLID